MSEKLSQFDVIIVGGSYSGLAAGMALGRALRNVLIIDNALPCNRQTPRSHNFITHDGKAPGEIAMLARKQVMAYNSVRFTSDTAVTARKTTEGGFLLSTLSGETFYTKKIVFATGIKDIMHPIPGFAESWGVSVLHCPYCHGYEVKEEATGILANGETAFELATLISNWTKMLTVFTNGKSTITIEQQNKLAGHNIKIIDKEITALDHTKGLLNNIIFNDGSRVPIKAIYARVSFKQHSNIPELLGCELTDDGFIKTDVTQKTTVPGIYACGDNTTRIRTVANAVAMGTTAGMMINREIVFEEF